MGLRIDNDIVRETTIDNLLNTLPFYVSEWDNSMKAAKNTTTSRLDYIRKLKRFLYTINTNLMDIEIDDIDKRSVDKYLASITMKKDRNGKVLKTSDSYNQSIWCCLNNFFETMIEYGYVEKNPINMKRKPKNKDLDRINKERIFLDERDFKEILNAVDGGAGGDKAKARQIKWKNRDLCILKLLMTTGMRETALSEIEISDIDFNNNKIQIEDKGDKIHIYDINDNTMQTLNDWIKDRKDMFNDTNTNALFLSYTGDRLTNKSIVKIVKKYTNEALGKEMSPHKLRAGFVSIMYNKTGNLEKVRRMVGHSNISTTQRYTITENKERFEAAMIWENIL